MKPPAFPLYAADFYMDTASWTAAEVGAYFRLLMHEWVNGPLPSKNVELARIAGVDIRNMKKMWEETIGEKFKNVPPGYCKNAVSGNSTLRPANMYVNERLENIRLRQLEYREKQSEYGKLGYSVKQENIKKKGDFMSRVGLGVPFRNPSRVFQAFQFSLHHIRTINSNYIYTREEISKYLSLFPGNKTVQTFDDRGEKTEYAKIFHFDGDIPDSIYRELCSLNKRGAGIYQTINETDGEGRRACNVVRVRSLAADLDGTPLPAANDLNPTLIVESSPQKYHCYWFTDDTPIGAFTPMQENVARILHSDPKVKDLSRVLRIPGFYHNKKEPFLSRVYGGSGIVYQYRELVEMFPPLAKPQFSGKRYQIEKKAFPGEYNGNYGTSEGDRNNHVLRRIGGMIKANKTWDYISSEAYKEGLACIPPLSEREVSAILESARRYL